MIYWNISSSSYYKRFKFFRIKCFYSNFFLLLFLDLGFLRELILELGIEPTFLINLVSYIFKFKIDISDRILDLNLKFYTENIDFFFKNPRLISFYIKYNIITLNFLSKIFQENVQF